MNDESTTTSGSTETPQEPWTALSGDTESGAGISTAETTSALPTDVTDEQAGSAPLRRPKFRDRGTAPVTDVTSPFASTPPARGGRLSGRQVRGILAAIAALVIVVIVLIQALHPGAPTTTPATGPTSSTGSVTTPANANPAGALTAAAGAPLATQSLIPPGGVHLIEPHEAVLGPGKAIYVADPGAHVVAVFNQHGAYQRSIKRPGKLQSMTPFSLVTCPNGALYVLDDSTDLALARILDYVGPANKLTQTIGAGAYLSRGRGLACDAANNLYVANPANNSIVVYSGTQGKLMMQRQTALSTVLGQYNQPSGVAIGPGGAIFVLDTSNKRIEEFSAQWQPLAQWPAPLSDTYHTPHMLALDKDHLLVTDPSGSLLEYDLSTHPASLTRHTLAGVQGAIPLGISRLDKTHVLVTDVGNRAVWKVTLP